MPSIEELLNEAESHMAAQPVNDVLEIDPETREISIPDSEIILGVETDQKAERKYFHCPKIVGNNIDLSKLELFVVFQNAGGITEEFRDRYHVTDVESTEDGYITFSWELSAKVTAYMGDVQFVVCAIKADSDGTKQNVWNTTIAIGKCLIGLSSDMTLDEEYKATDLYTQLIQELEEKASQVSPVELQATVSENNVVTVDKTFSEIYELINSDKKVVLNITKEDQTYTLNLSDVSSNEIVFRLLKLLGENILQLVCIVRKNETASFGTTQLNVSNEINESLQEAKESGAFDGKDGNDGKTPVKGVDYFTESDKQEIVGEVNKLSTMSDKKVLIIGDSISTDAYANYKKWVSDLIDDGFFLPSNVTNNSYHATGFVRTYDESGKVVYDNFLNRIKTINNPTSYDYTITFGGINDYIGSIAWDKFTANVDAYFSYLVTHFPQARNVVLLPLRTYNVYQNTQGHYQQEYSAYIAKVAKSYALPVLDLTHGSGFYPFIDEFKKQWTLIPSGYTSPDGVHPNLEYGKKFLAPLIKGFLLNPTASVWVEQKDPDLSDYYNKSETQQWVISFLKEKGILTEFGWDAANRTDGDAIAVPNTVISTNKYYTNVNVNTAGFGKTCTGVSITEDSVTFSNGTYYGGIGFPFKVNTAKKYKLSLTMPIGCVGYIDISQNEGDAFVSPLGTKHILKTAFSSGEAGTYDFTITPATEMIMICFATTEAQNITFSNISLNETN